MTNKKTKYSKGIYERKGSFNVKVVGKNIGKGWGKDTTVLQFTNNKGFGKSYFGLKGKYLENFMKGYKKRANKRKTTKKKKK
jgi:hypothetical protein